MRLVHVIFAVAGLMVVGGLGGCASFDHSKNEFVVGKTTCAEIIRQAGRGTSYPDGVGGISLQYPLSESVSPREHFQVYDCNSEDVLEGMHPFKGVPN